MNRFLRKIFILNVIYFLGIVGLLIFNVKINFENFVNELKKVIVKFEKKHTKEHLEDIKYIYEFLLKEYKSPQEIKKLLKELIYYKNQKEMNRYIFVLEVYNLNGGENFAKMIINPNVKKLEGKFLNSNFKDVKGHKFREDMLKIARTKKEGFVSYYYKDPITGKIEKKITYMIYLPKIHWIVASGVYVNYLNFLAQRYKKYLVRDVVLNMIVVFLFLVFITLIMIYMHNRLLKEFHKENEKEKEILKLIPLIDEDITSFKFDSPYLKKAFEIMGVEKFGVFKGKERVFGDAEFEDENAIKYKRYYFVFKDKKEEFLPVLNHIASIFFQAFKKQGYEQRLVNKIKEQIEKIKEKDKELIIKEKNAALGEVVGNISHQWKQPLNAISGVTNNLLLDLELGECNKENIKKSLKEIQKITKNMADIINVFRRLYKNNSIKDVLSLKEVFDNVFLIFDSIGVKIHKEIEDCSFYGYLNELEQVILTILSNAKDEFKRKNIKGEIYIKAKCGDYITIEIEDNAGGVDEEIKEKIFDEFFSTKNSTGLGLAFSKKIIEKSFNGKIWVENTKKGAKFVITFPNVKAKR
jgi:signal transduction histidine kinase